MGHVLSGWRNHIISGEWTMYITSVQHSAYDCFLGVRKKTPSVVEEREMAWAFSQQKDMDNSYMYVYDDDGQIWKINKVFTWGNQVNMKTGYASFIRRYWCFMKLCHRIHMQIPFSKYKYEKHATYYKFSNITLNFSSLAFRFFLCTNNFFYLKYVFEMTQVSQKVYIESPFFIIIF